MNNPARGRLPWQAIWGSERAKMPLVIACILAAVMTLGFVFMAGSEYRNGSFGGLLFGALGACLGAMLICVVLPYLRVRRRKLPSDIETSDCGLRLSFRRHVYFSLAGLFVVGAMLLIFPLLGSIGQVVNRNDSASPSTSAVTMQSMMIGATFIAVVFLAGYMLLTVAGRNRMVINEAGIEICQARVRRAVCWENIRDVVPIEGNAGPAVRIIADSLGSISVESFAGNRRSKRVPADMQVHPQALGVDPPTILYLLKFYLNNPEKRRELSTFASVDRIRRGDLIG